LVNHADKGDLPAPPSSSTSKEKTAPVDPNEGQALK
jgi:hypothetical protein